MKCFIILQITYILGCIVVTDKAVGMPKITIPPVSMTAYLDTLVSFHCEGEGEILIWQTNSMSLTDEIKETRNITVYQDDTTPGFVNSTLEILAKLDNDGLNIGCIVGNHSAFVFDSVGADLLVKAIGPVEDLFFNISINETARVSWNPPSFVADNIKYLSYRVLIKDGNDDVLHTITPEFEYEVSIDILSLCSIYTVIVTASGDEYTSDSSIIQQEYIGEYSATIVEDNISVEETGNFTVEFTIKIEGNPRLCNSVIRGYTHLSNPVDGDNYETKHDPESIETNNDTYIAKYTVRNLGQQLNYIFDCQIEDTLNNIKDTVHQEFSTNHVQDFTAYVHENGSIYVQCIFANNSNASGCGLNFTQREDTTVTLYSVQINKIQGSVKADGYIDLPISGNFTVIVFDILENIVSERVTLIYNQLPEIKVVTATPTVTNIYMYFSSSSYHTNSDGDSIQSTAILSVQVSSIPTIEVKSTNASNIIIILGCVFFWLVVIITGIGILVYLYFKWKRKGDDNDLDSDEGVRLRAFIRSSETTEVLSDGLTPNPLSISSQSPPPASPHYRLQTSCVSEDVSRNNISDINRDTTEDTPRCALVNNKDIPPSPSDENLNDEVSNDSPKMTVRHSVAEEATLSEIFKEDEPIPNDVKIPEIQQNMPTSPSVNNVDTPPSTSLELAEVSNDKKPTLLETSEKDEHIFNDVKTQEIIQDSPPVYKDVIYEHLKDDDFVEEKGTVEEKKSGGETKEDKTDNKK